MWIVYTTWIVYTMWIVYTTWIVWYTTWIVWYTTWNVDCLVHQVNCLVHHLDHNGMQLCTTWVQSKVIVAMVRFATLVAKDVLLWLCRLDGLLKSFCNYGHTGTYYGIA